MLDTVCKYLPSPLDKDDIKGTDPRTDAEITRKPSVDEPFAALAFKIATDPFIGKISILQSLLWKTGCWFLYLELSFRR